MNTGSTKYRTMGRAIVLAFAVMTLASSPIAFAAGASTDPLFVKVASLDTEVFDAFNQCSQPEQLRKHASYFAPDVEFFHDTGGVTWTAHAMIANTQKNVCGQFRRELVPGSLKVYPIKEYGAIEQGVHRFCQFKSGKCDGIADFVIVWRQRGDVWKITRILSYGHRENS